MTRPVWPGQPGAGCRRFGSACDGGPRRSGWSRATSATERRRSVAGRRSTHGSAAARARDRAAAQLLRSAARARRGTWPRHRRACRARMLWPSFWSARLPPTGNLRGERGAAGPRGWACVPRALRPVLSCRARFRHRLFGTATGRPGVQLRGAQRAVRAHSGMPAQLRLRGGSRGVFGTRPALERCGTVSTFDSELAWLFRRQRRVLARRSASHAGGG